GEIPIDIVAIQDRAFWSDAWLSGTDEQLGDTIALLFTERLAQIQAGGVRFHHHVNKGGGDTWHQGGGSVEYLQRLCLTRRRVEAQGYAIHVKMPHRQPRHLEDIRFVIDNEYFPLFKKHSEAPFPHHSLQREHDLGPQHKSIQLSRQAVLTYFSRRDGRNM